MAGEPGGSAVTAEPSPGARSPGPRHRRRPDTAPATNPSPPGESRTRPRRWGPDALGVLWVLAAAGAALTPALAHGWSLGNYAAQTLYGGLASSRATVHYTQASDQLTLFMPLTNLAWTQVHAGHLPLWNPYNALGLPLAFNWESATFSVPVLLGYLAPLHLAYTVQVLVTYAIAGTGMYVLARVMRLGVLASVMAATVFELSGPVFGLVGWSFGGVMAWAGWLLAAAILVMRGARRGRAVVFFAVVVACAIYGGEPEAVVFLGIATALLIVAVLGARLLRLGQSGPVLRPLVDLVVGGVAGAALGAPLLLPGTQVGGVSLRNFRGGQVSLGGPSTAAKALPLHDLVHVLFQGFDGLPVAGTPFFSDRYIYIDTVAYVGVIAVVLAVVALAKRWRDPEVLTFGAITVVMAGLVFASPLVKFLDHLPLQLGGVLWYRAVAPMALGLAVLAGVGTDILVRSGTRRDVRTWLGGGFAAAALVLGALWLFGRGHLTPVEATFRAKSFIWPVVATALGLGVFVWLTRAHRREHDDGRRATSPRVGAGAAIVLLVCETAFLVVSGVPVWWSSPTGFTPTPAVVALGRAVGSGVVGHGTTACDSQAITVNVNAVYGIRELAAYDPVIPRAYFLNWRAITGKPAGPAGNFIYCPAITTTALARRYGVNFVLEPHGVKGPRGSVFDKRIGTEELYRIPGAAAATLTALPATGGLPGPDATGTPVAVAHPGPASWKLVTHSTTSAVLRLRLTDLPGWHATIDGRPLALTGFSGIMLQARIPAGTHSIELHYWPDRFTEGLVLAAAGVLGLCAVPIVGRFRRRRS
jgi:Bacterial membrane protein YfhO